MIDSDRKAFAEAMTALAALYEKELPPPVIEMYWRALRGWSLAGFQDACAHLCGTSKFMPKPADFHELRRASRPTAAEAWGLAVNHAATSAYRDYSSGSVSENGEIGVGDPTIDLCVRALGGYSAIGMTDRDDLHYLERRFTEHYEAKLDADETREAIPELTQTTRPQLGGPPHISEFAKKDS